MSNESLAAKKGLEQGPPDPNRWEWLLGFGGMGEEGFIPNLGLLDTCREVPSAVRGQLVQGQGVLGHYSREMGTSVCLPVTDTSKEATKVQICEPVIFIGVAYSNRGEGLPMGTEVTQKIASPRSTQHESLEA